jgi:hypothetical protein
MLISFIAFFFDTHTHTHHTHTHTTHKHTHTQTYQRPVPPHNSTLTSTKNQRIFPLLVQTTLISPDVINVSTGADPSCLPLQKQTTKEEDKAAGKALLCLRPWVCSRKGLRLCVEFFCILFRPLHGATATSGPRSSRYRGGTITLRHAHSIGLLWTSDRPTQRPLPNNTQHSQETDIIFLRRDSKARSQLASGRRPTLQRGCWDRPLAFPSFSKHTVRAPQPRDVSQRPSVAHGTAI